MIPEPLSENHVISIFIQNLHLKLRYIFLDYVTFPFLHIVTILTPKEKCLIEMGEIKYENPSKETKGSRYQKKEEKEVHSIKEPPSKEK